MSYSPGGYSWLGIAPEPKNIPMTEKEKNRLSSDVDSMKRSALSLEEKITRYHALCKKYEREAGTEKGASLLNEMQALKNEIQHLSKEISRSLDDSSDLTHLDG
ncbi:MAG: hypothetical protein K0U10_06675 [Gammaproteobacteria bacterium]|nr:hypothetical protein [Chlamydiales bacterium]MCH9690318.1 hypothetical protein [Gammaproteobacteria bacterium]